LFVSRTPYTQGKRGGCVGELNSRMVGELNSCRWRVEDQLRRLESGELNWREVESSARGGGERRAHLEGG